jgi:uncharacterized small protein (DUF1192 family)
VVLPLLLSKKQPFLISLAEIAVAFLGRSVYTWRPMNAEQMEEIKRHFGVVAESLRSDIRQIAEGHATIRHELQGLRNEFRDEFKEMRALMRLSFSQLDQRISALESDIATLKTRMDRLETSRA